ncbi:Peptidyl-prolyl cis-trans isomerase E, related [Eimeria necatrix]|uniref:Peptidyl-prolyl cis-trans isomerase n=1 Tax=Eimeria necatrix TaxID=51315 RepID=U6N0D9_9EIME|nr:Peptidyl-prolyl cis-trans isomerase E, related [Eimeria necatrix]CDJ68209.1 Peptidyl-prolyl cis-trans isomerase E, related [Eimeria necatrix]
MGGPGGALRPLGPRVQLPNPLVFLDIAVGNRNAGRLIFQLFADQLPITAENFRCLCTGETGLGYYMRPRWYKGSPFHRIIPGFMAQGGDFHRGDGYGGESIYGQFMRDEKYLYKHSKRGLLSMAKGRDRHSSSSQFFITFQACPWLDGQHVVFGQLEAGQETLLLIEAAGSAAGKPRKPVSIFNWSACCCCCCCCCCGVVLLLLLRCSAAAAAAV